MGIGIGMGINIGRGNIIVGGGKRGNPGGGAGGVGSNTEA